MSTICLIVVLILAPVCAAAFLNRRNAKAAVSGLFKATCSNMSGRERMRLLLEHEADILEQHNKRLRQLRNCFTVALRDFQEARGNIARELEEHGHFPREWCVAFYDAQRQLEIACASAWREMPAISVDQCAAELLHAYERANRFLFKSMACKNTIAMMRTLLQSTATSTAEVKRLNDIASPLRELSASTRNQSM